MLWLVQTPLNIKPNTVIRRLIAKLEIPCPDCQKSVARGDLTSHQEHSCSKSEVAEAKGASEQKETKISQSSILQTQEIKSIDKQMPEKNNFVLEEEREGSFKVLLNKNSILYLLHIICPCPFVLLVCIFYMLYCICIIVSFSEKPDYL